MKCPYRKITKHARMGISSTDTWNVEDFAECYGKECPFFVPEQKFNSFTVSETCSRTITNETIKEWLQELKKEAQA